MLYKQLFISLHCIFDELLKGTAAVESTAATDFHLIITRHCFYLSSESVKFLQYFMSIFSKSQVVMAVNDKVLSQC